MNVLITSAGRRTTLVRAFAEAVRPHGGLVIAGDIDSLAPSLFIADKAIRLPPVSSPTFIESLCAEIEQNTIKLIIPTIDTELELLARSRERLSALGCMPLVSSVELVVLTQDKHHAVQYFGGQGIRVPASWIPSELDGAETDFPPQVFVKPRQGSASQHTYKVELSNLDAVLRLVPDPMIQEAVEAPEITVDALLDLQGRLLHYVPRLRIRTLAGESIQGVTLPDRPVRDWLMRVLELIGKLGGIGPITVQAFLTEPEPTLSEVNARFGGGFPLANAAGGRYPEWIVAMCRGESLTPRIGSYQVGLYMTRANTETFVEHLPWL